MARPTVGPKGLDIQVELDGSYSALQVRYSLLGSPVITNLLPLYLQIIDNVKTRVKIEFDNVSKRWLPVLLDGRFTPGWSHIRHKGKFDQFIAQHLASKVAEAVEARKAEKVITRK